MMNRYLIRIAALLLTLQASAACAGREAPEPDGPQLGANFNEEVSVPLAHVELLRESRVDWVRGFVHIPHFFLETDGGRISGVKRDAIAAHPGTRDFVEAKKALGERVKFIMSLKIPFEDFGHLVPEAGTPEMGYLLEAIELFLKSYDLAGNIEILVMGNEPEWENGDDPATKEANALRYADFLNLLADRLTQWKAANGWTFEVYAGALNRVSELHKSAVVPAVIGVVNDNPNVDGLDLHIHARNIVQAGDDLKIVRGNYNVTKPLICTEFSMVRILNEHTGEELGEWGTANGYPAGMKMYEYLNHVAAQAAAGTPVPSGEFLGYFESRPWYPAGWYRTFYGEFEKYDVHAVTGRFIVERSRRPYTEKSTMWDLGGIYSEKLMGAGPDGLANPSPLVYPEFRAIADELYGK